MASDRKKELTVQINLHNKKRIRKYTTMVKRK